MTIEYRDATLDDVTIVATLFRDSFTETFGHLYQPKDLAAFFAGCSEAAWREEFADPDLTIRLAEDGCTAVGFAKISPPTLPVTIERPSLELRQLYVLQPWQGHGIAPVLMDWALGEARRRRARDLYLSVYVDNHRARRFYERYGFRFVARYDFMVGEHADEDHIMRLSLED